MEHGMLGFCAGGIGPCFFIYLMEQTDTHWGHQHTVFAKVDDEASFDKLSEISKLPTDGAPNAIIHHLRKSMSMQIRHSLK